MVPQRKAFCLRKTLSVTLYYASRGSQNATLLGGIENFFNEAPIPPFQSSYCGPELRVLLFLVAHCLGDFGPAF